MPSAIDREQDHVNRDVYKLHSHGENWFHFRKNMDSAMDSFSVTYCHDGTVCMTGDYGCLCWQREFFPEKLDYGFPGKKNGIGYFAQKVVRAEEDQKIHTWKRDLAIGEIKEAIEKYQEEGYTKAVEVLKKVYDRLDYFEDGHYGYIQMLEAFNQVNDCLDSEDFYHYGRCYTDAFTMRYDMLTSVSEQILQAVAKNAHGIAKIKEARDYIKKYTRSNHSLILFDEAIKEAKCQNIS